MVPLIHVIIAGASILAAGLLAVGLGFLAHRRQESQNRYDNEAPVVTTFIGFLVGAIGVVILVLGLVPFNAKYYPIYERSGVVSEVSNQFISGSGKNTSQTFILTLEGDDTAYVLDDARVSMLNADRVDLACTIEWVPNGADRWNCIIGNP